MQAAEGFIPLGYLPVLAVEFHLDQIVGVRPVVSLVLNHLGLHDLYLQRYLKEEAALPGAILRALLHMLNEVFLGEENVAELALHGDRVLEDTLIDLYLGNFLCQMPVTLFNILDRLRQVLISTHELFSLFCLRGIALVLR